MWSRLYCIISSTSISLLTSSVVVFGFTLPDAFDRSWPSDRCAPCVSTALIMASIALSVAILLAVPKEVELSCNGFAGCWDRENSKDTNVIVIVAHDRMNDTHLALLCAATVLLVTMISQQSDVDTTPRQGFSIPVPSSLPALDAAHTSLISPNIINSDASPEQQNEVEMPPKGPRESSKAPRGNQDPAPSRPGVTPQPPTLPDLEEHHTSPLDDLLSPTTTPAKIQSFVR